METVKLTETEQQYFGELFCACDVDNIGKISGMKAYDLFLGSQLPVETISQITDLCGAKRLGHFGRSQFYIALKLIAAAQAGLPLKPDSFASGIEIPLPKFVRINDIDKKRQHQQMIYSAQTSGEVEFGKLQESSKHASQTQQPRYLPPPPTKVSSRNSMNQRPSNLYSDVETINQMASGGSQGNSPCELPPKTVSTVTEPVTPTNSVSASQSRTDKSWTTFQKLNQVPDGQKLWDQFDEDRQLLGTEEESSDRHSSDEEFDIWIITDEQREYYTNQFKSMQPDLNGLLSGIIAKDFFEKSKLPVQELSKIWQLSDVNKDGALSLEEFCTAMHLVVLRRNNIELPKVLPSTLIPRIGKTQTEDGSSAMFQNPESPTRSPPEPSSPHNKEWTRFNDSPTSSLSSPGSKPVNFDFQKSAVEQDPKILHPVPLRLSPDNQVSSADDKEIIGESIPYEPVVEQKSPSKRLVNSDSLEFKSGALLQTAIQRPVPKKPAVPGPGAIPPPPQTINTISGMEENVDANNMAIGAFPASSSTGSFATQSQVPLPQGPKKEPPPPPPPRPKKNHARSSSLDLNRLGALGAPPAVPPRMSPSTIITSKKMMGRKSEPDVVTLLTEEANFADFTQLSPEFSSSLASGDVPQIKAGAFEVYRRPESSQYSSKLMASTAVTLPPGLSGFKSPDETFELKEDNFITNEKIKDEGEEKKISIKSPNRLVDKHLLRAAIRSQRDSNTILSRLNSELNQELSEVMEERIALEIQLEHLKPFST